MRRREFLGTASAGASLTAQPGLPPDTANDEAPAGVVVEGARAGRPHAGKVLLAVQPHADDIPLFAAGTVAKLLDEGYTGHLVRVTNDDMAGPGTIGETALANEKDNDRVARVLGLKQVFNLNYNNHWMDGVSRPELRLRFIYLIHFARGPQLVNRIVDIGSTIDKKVEANLVNLAQGPAGRAGERLRASLAERQLKLPVLGDDDATANRQYVKEFVLRANRELGRRHGLEYAEAFHYVGPNALALGYSREEMDEYIQRNAVPLGAAPGGMGR